jgi:MFS family permease
VQPVKAGLPPWIPRERRRTAAQGQDGPKSAQGLHELAVASQNLGSLVSGLLAVLLALALSKSSLNEWGWRIPFALGVLIAPVGITIRSRLIETLDGAPHERPGSAGVIVSIVVRSNWLGPLLGLALVSGSTITQYFPINMTPYRVRTLHLPSLRLAAKPGL